MLQKIDFSDILICAGLFGLGAGLYVWLGIGISLSITGGILLAMGISTNIFGGKR